MAKRNLVGVFVLGGEEGGPKVGGIGMKSIEGETGPVWGERVVALSLKR